MKMPWKDKTGLAKAAAILATTLSISLASCGVNFVLVLNNLNAGGSGAWARDWLFDAGRIELAVMGTSLLGLLVVLVLWIAAKLHRKGRDESGGAE
jgi:hypothetical protein